MTEMDVHRILNEALAEKLRFPISQIANGTRLLDIGLDSLRLMDVLMAFEGGIKLEIPSDALSQIAESQTVGEMAALLEKALTRGTPRRVAAMKAR